MIMPLPALIELNVRSLLNILNGILAVSVFDDTNDEVEPSAIRYCEEVPPLLTIELAMIVPITSNFEVGVVVPIPTFPVVVMFPFWSMAVFSTHTSGSDGELEPIYIYRFEPLDLDRHIRGTTV